MTGYGLDGILYTFVVTPKKAIPYFQKLTDEILQRKMTDDNLTEPHSTKNIVYLTCLAAPVF